MMPADIVSLTELGQDAVSRREARQRWRQMVAYLKAAAVCAARLKAEKHAALERERARTARRDRSAYLAGFRAERARLKALGRPVPR